MEAHSTTKTTILIAKKLLGNSWSNCNAYGIAIGAKVKIVKVLQAESVLIRYSII